MNCNEVIPLLSPFHDGELPALKHQAVEAHVSTCAACAQKLESIRRLSDLVEVTPVSEVPRTLLMRIEQSLNGRASTWASFQLSGPQRRTAAAILAVAAVALVGLIIWGIGNGRSRNHAEMVRAFGEFLSAYELGKTNAAEMLPRKYQGTLVNEASASSALRHQTVAQSVVLTDHQATKRYLLKMPCCNCVETIYVRNGRTSLVLFEHEKEQSDWFDARPMIRSECRGKACCLIQLNGCLAAAWPVDAGFVTVVGVRDVAELGSLVDELRPQ